MTRERGLEFLELSRDVSRTSPAKFLEASCQDSLGFANLSGAALGGSGGPRGSQTLVHCHEPRAAMTMGTATRLAILLRKTQHHKEYADSFICSASRKAGGAGEAELGEEQRRNNTRLAVVRTA